MGKNSFIIFKERAGESPVVEKIWSSHSERAGRFQSIAACHWGMVVTRYRGKTSLTVRGPETRATMADCPAEGEWFGICFKPGTFMPVLRPGILRDRNDVTLPEASGRSFWLNGSAWEYPTAENAEIFVKRLLRGGLVVEDPLVKGVLSGRGSGLTERTEQRRFLQITGMTRGTIYQITRARFATILLRGGASILDATFRAGYYDQAHLTRSLKRWIGQTPAQIIRGWEQLSLLYNTEMTEALTVGA